MKFEYTKIMNIALRKTLNPNLLLFKWIANKGNQGKSSFCFCKKNIKKRLIKKIKTA